MSSSSTVYMGLSKMILNVILIVILLKFSRCSLVLDPMAQNTLYVSSYCPAMKNCMEGSHVICQYYKHHNTVGPQCINYVKVSITPQIVQQILEGVNKIRIKLATGEETGKDELPLPRAYGMMRMNWDSELATLAQVLADQCLGLKEDNCRATGKFSDPSQIITLINFNAPNWEYLTGNTTKLGLDEKKVSYSIDKALKSLHGIKRMISTNEINSCPMLESLQDKGSRSYLKLIRGKATHIGCGISAYTRPYVLTSGSQHIYNSIQLVCNVSDGPLVSQPLYMTDPPIPDTGFTKKCGCAEGYRDSMGCLCETDTHGNIENTEEIRQHNLDKYDGTGRTQSHEAESCTEPDGNCDGKPNIVVLPIFEINDAPNRPYEPDNDVEMQFHEAFGNTSFIEASASSKENEIPDDEIYPETENVFLRKHKNYTRNHEFRRAMSSEQHEKEFVSHNDVPISVEATADHYDHAYASIDDNILDQEPRQSSDYDDKIDENDEHRYHTEEESSFLTILDHLEKAVKNVELEDNEKDIFDLKMRRIYEAALKSKTEHESGELENEFTELTDYLKQKSDAAEINKNLHSRKEDKYDFLNRKDYNSYEFYTGIDDKLITILSKKHQYNDDYFTKHGDNVAYPNYPTPRKQEKIEKYDNDITESKKKKSYLDLRNLKKIRSAIAESHYTKKQSENKINHERNRNKLDNKIKKHKNNRDQAIQNYGRRIFSYPKHKVKKTPISPGYRRIFETENERPTLPTATIKYEKMEVEIHKKKYLKKDRPIL